MNYKTNTIESLSVVTNPTDLSAKNFLIMSMIDTYNGSSDPTYQIYKISENTLLRGHKPTIVDVSFITAAVDKIYNDFNALSSNMQDRGSADSKTGMMDEISGYILTREVANDIAKMIHEEDVPDLADKFANHDEVNAVVSEIYAKSEELAQEVMDYAAALGMALITAHAPVGADVEEEPLSVLT